MYLFNFTQQLWIAVFLLWSETFIWSSVLRLFRNFDGKSADDLNLRMSTVALLKYYPITSEANGIYLKVHSIPLGYF